MTIHNLEALHIYFKPYCCLLSQALLPSYAYIVTSFNFIIDSVYFFLRAKRETAREVGGRFVMSHVWDLEDPRLLVCEANSLHSTKKQRDHYLTSASKEDRVSSAVKFENPKPYMF